jgi:hypothetical protein
MNAWKKIQAAHMAVKTRLVGSSARVLMGMILAMMTKPAKI